MVNEVTFIGFELGRLPQSPLLDPPLGLEIFYQKRHSSVTAVKEFTNFPQKNKSLNQRIVEPVCLFKS